MGANPAAADAVNRADVRPTFHLLAWGVLLCVGILLFVQSYQAWGDLVIDLGRDLYLPGQLLAGRVLYRDVLYNYGPVAPYLLAGVVALFGDSLRVFSSVGVLSGLSCMVALYLTGWRLGGIPAGFSTSLFFLVFSFFANSTWGCNFVLPYSFAATLGMSFALWSFYFLLRYLFWGRRPRALALRDGLSPPGGLLQAGNRRRDRRCLPDRVASPRVPRKALAAAAAAAVLAAAASVALFAARGGTGHALFAENLDPARFGGSAGDAFFLAVAGLDEPLERLGSILRAVLTLTAVVGGALLAHSVPGACRNRKMARAVAGVVAVPAAALAVWFFADVHLLAAATPIGAILLLVLITRRRWDDPLLLLTAFTLLSALRIPLSAEPLWYGFYLCAPAYRSPCTALASGCRASCGHREWCPWRSRPWRRSSWCASSCQCGTDSSPEAGIET